MILPRSHTWMHLLPPDGSYQYVGDVPDWFRAPLGRAGVGGRVLVAAGRARPGPGDLGRFDGVVIVNGGDGRRDVDGLRASGFADVRRFAVLPSLEDARWFIPLEGPAVARAAFCLYTPFRPSARFKLFAARGAIAARIPLWYRDRITIAQRAAPPLVRELRAVFDGRPVALALSSGAVGPDERRKPTVAVLGAGGERLGFAKIAGSPVAAGLIRHEARVLPVLSERTGGRRLSPRLLWAGEVGGAPVIVQSPVPGRRVGPRWTAAHQDFLDALGGVDGGSKPAASTGLVASLRDRVQGDPGLSAALRAVEPWLEETWLPATVTHTDLVPWNLRSDRGELAAFDWDTAELDGLPLFDEWHHTLMVGYCIDHWSARRGAEALDASSRSAPLGLRPGAVRALQVVYLVHGLRRMLDQGHADDHPMVRWYRHLLASAHGSAVQALRETDRLAPLTAP